MSTQQERNRRKRKKRGTWPEPLPECECVQCANARANGKLGADFDHCEQFAAVRNWVDPRVAK